MMKHVSSINRVWKLYRELGDKGDMSKLLHQLGTLAQDTGQYDEARKLYQQSMEIERELGDKMGHCFFRAQLALMEEKTRKV